MLVGMVVISVAGGARLVEREMTRWARGRSVVLPLMALEAVLQAALGAAMSMLSRVSERMCAAEGVVSSAIMKVTIAPEVLLDGWWPGGVYMYHVKRRS